MTLSPPVPDQSPTSKHEDGDSHDISPWILLYALNDVDVQKTQECFDRICESLQILTHFTLAISEESQQPIIKRVSKVKRHVIKLAALYEYQLPTRTGVDDGMVGGLFAL
jgi:hypothetical protein